MNIPPKTEKIKNNHTKIGKEDLNLNSSDYIVYLLLNQGDKFKIIALCKQTILKHLFFLYIISSYYDRTTKTHSRQTKVVASN